MYHKQTVAALMFFVLLLGLPTAAAAQQNPSSAYTRIFDLLRTNQVSRITVIHVPDYIETRIRIDPKALRELSRVELSFTKPDEGKLLESLQTAIVEIRTAKSSPDHEVRWGVLFFDRTGKERSAVFLDTTGRFAEVDGTPLLVQGQILTWINKTIRETFK